MGIGPIKRCKKLPEPISLTGYRAENPDAKWDEMRNDPHHDGIRAAQETKVTLIRGQRCLCAFCECLLAADSSDESLQAHKANQRVEHFRPKSSARPPNWDLLWTNLWTVCMGGSAQTEEVRSAGLHPLPDNLSCDAFKDHQQQHGRLPADPAGRILAPDEVPAFPRLFAFSPDGVPEPDFNNCEKVAIASNQYLTTREMVSKTIEHLNLGCFRLAERRRIARAQLEKRIEQTRKQNPGKHPREVMEVFARSLFSTNSDRAWPEFFTLIRWRLGEVAEKQLTDMGYDG